MKAFDIYRKNPHIFLPVYKIQKKLVKQHYDNICSFEYLSDDECNRIEFLRVKDIVEYAYMHVPYYHCLYKEAGVDPMNLKDWNDFGKLPCISKKDIKEHSKDFLSDEFNALKHKVCYTGGSTDTPLEFYLDDSILGRETATFIYYWYKNGYRYGKDKCILFRGDKVANLDLNKFYATDQLSNFRRFDSRYINSHLPIYDSQIKEFGARFLQAYPSSAYNLARAYMESGLIPPKFDTIFLGSENVFRENVTYIKEVFGTKKVIYHYGHSECVLFASKYEGNDCLGFYPQYGHAEIINRDNRGVGEIVGTSYSKSLPFIRYKTGDYAEISDYKSDDYMRHCVSVKKIEGRKQEYFVSKESNLIPVAMFTHFKEFNAINGDFQYRQSEKGIVELHMIDTEENRSAELQQAILRCVSKGLDNKIDLHFVYVDEIKKTRNGKIVLMQQELNTDDFR